MDTRKQRNHSHSQSFIFNQKTKVTGSWVFVFTLLPSSTDHLQSLLHFFVYMKEAFPSSRHYLWGNKQHEQQQHPILKFSSLSSLFTVVINALGTIGVGLKIIKEDFLSDTLVPQPQYLKYNWVDGVLEHPLLEVFLLTFPSPSKIFCCPSVCYHLRIDEVQLMRRKEE